MSSHRRTLAIQDARQLGEPLPRALEEALERASIGRELHWSGPVELCQAEPRIAVIGTRKPGPQSLAAIEALASQLAAGGGVIVSGAAQGTDMQAHRASLDQGKPTIACLPRGLGDIRWPSWRREFAEMENSDLLLLLSPFGQRQALNRQTPILRNRLIAALAGAVVVGEAGLNSGTHWCVRAARDFRIPLFFLSPGEGDVSLESALRGMEQKGARRFSFDEACSPELAREILAAARRYHENLRREDRAQLRLFAEDKDERNSG